MKDYSRQIEELNKLPLNQEAKFWLKLTGESPEPYLVLHIFQLMLWGIDSDRISFQTEDWGDQVRNALEILA